MLRTLPVALFAVFAWAGCMGPQTPSAKANDAARELNVDSRFGDIASVVSMTSPAVREQFLSRRAEWGHLIRVVDVELASFEMTDIDHAKVMVDFSWTRVDEGTLHTTRVHQDWSDTDGSWQLVRERRASGDVGLFGERTTPLDVAPRPDVQFATRVIP
ncbi:MAG TPA: hypothetical protein VMI54_27495 [Polyangiaceae bacterium]|nr:hypothetical protein [Polyangiaceae bacterium]